MGYTAAKSLRSVGVEVHRGDLEDLASLRIGAANSDAVIHLAFNHDFSKYLDNCEADRRAIEAIGGVLAGSDRPLIVTAGTAMLTPGRCGTEDDAPIPSSAGVPRSASEEAADSVAARGVRLAVVRLPPSVHDREKAWTGFAVDHPRCSRPTLSRAYVTDHTPPRITERTTEERCRVRWPASCSTKVVSRCTRAEQTRAHAATVTTSRAR